MYDPRFLPICKEDLDELGWDYVDVIIISADAYALTWGTISIS